MTTIKGCVSLIFKKYRLTGLIKELGVLIPGRGDEATLGNTHYPIICTYLVR